MSAEEYTGDPACERLARDAIRDPDPEPNEEPAFPRPRIYRTLRPVPETVWYLDEMELCRIRGDGAITVSKHKFTPRQAAALLSALLTHWQTQQTDDRPTESMVEDILHRLDMSL